MDGRHLNVVPLGTSVSKHCTMRVKKRGGGGGGGECFGSFPVGLADEAPLASYLKGLL